MNLDIPMPADANWRENVNVSVAGFINQNSDLIFHGKARTEWPMNKQIRGNLTDRITAVLQQECGL